MSTTKNLILIIAGLRRKKIVSTKGSTKLIATVTSDTSTPVENGSKPINVGSYVIVRYQKKYFPGIVITIIQDEYEVQTMTPFGSGLFKWPNPADQIWYKKKQCYGRNCSTGTSNTRLL